jgi:hypothetical protein
MHRSDRYSRQIVLKSRSGTLISIFIIIDKVAMNALARCLTPSTVRYTSATLKKTYLVYSFYALMHDYLILYLERGICITKVWQMKEPTVEEIFGVDAGIVWEALNMNGPSVIGDIVKASGLRRELVYDGLGWLAREDKIAVERRGRAMVFSLKQ